MRCVVSAAAAAVFLGMPSRAATPAPAPVVRIQEMGTARPTRYSRIMDELLLARRSGNVRLYSIGRTADGRMIPLALLTPVRTESLPPVRVLIICAQHGDEPASASAMAELIRACAARKNPGQLLSTQTKRATGSLRHLDSVLWLVAPMANPDGYAASTRANGAGADTNRDWTSASQPETRALRAVFNRWKPQVVLDLHQWSPGDPPPATNGLEIPPASRAHGQAELERTMACNALKPVNARGRRVILAASPDGANPSLAHRYFASRGAVAYLIETAAHASSRERHVLLQDQVLLISDQAGALLSGTGLRRLPHQAAFTYPADIATWLKDGTGDAQAVRAERLRQFGVWLVLALWAGLVLLRTATARQTHPETNHETPSTAGHETALPRGLVRHTHARLPVRSVRRSFRTHGVC